MIFFFFIENVFIFSMIFWILTWIAEYFFKTKNNKNKSQTYECGFKSISELNIQININFSIVCSFLILYDVEFIFLYPIFFNFFFLNFLIYFVLMFFLTWNFIEKKCCWQQAKAIWFASIFFFQFQDFIINSKFMNYLFFKLLICNK